MRGRLNGDIDCNVPRRLAIFFILARETWVRRRFELHHKIVFLLLTITVEPRYNEPLYSEVLGITNDFLYPTNYSKI